MENTGIITPTKWAINKSASNIGFRFRYLLFTVSGTFREYDTIVETRGEDFSTARIDFDADITSVNTNNPERDAGVKNYLENNKLPQQMSFRHLHIEKISEHNFRLHGELTILQTTQPIVLNMSFGGIHRTPGDHLSADFVLTGKVEYLDFVPEESNIRKIAFALNKTIDIEVKVKLDKIQQAA